MECMQPVGEFGWLVGAHINICESLILKNMGIAVIKFHLIYSFHIGFLTSCLHHNITQGVFVVKFVHSG